ncbi:DNA cytosine methyltransferase [Ferviditalea candida]|uniref:DNA (cytosine-5-)-methyltransferase n=1 Tax=Ferviditalea candida TaxID=3108399 RepID=A0ABU5ZK21_9BACL|nr:DNA cytosine methyltransferase [Paenibacillaceae bacterium T2]
MIGIHTWGPCIDLFCGAGGLSCGFAQAGFDIQVGVDVDASALLTFGRNHPQARAIKEDITRLTGDKLRELAGSGKVLGMIGGPPCQGYPEKIVIPKILSQKIIGRVEPAIAIQ